MFPMTITIQNEEQFNRVRAAILGAPLEQPIVKAVVEAVKQAEEVVKKMGDLNKEYEQTKKSEDSQSTGSTSDFEALDAPSATGESKIYTVDDAKRLTTDLVKAGKRDAAVALLGEFGVAQAAKLKDGQIGPFCSKAEGLLK